MLMLCLTKVSVQLEANKKRCETELLKNLLLLQNTGLEVPDVFGDLEGGQPHETEAERASSELGNQVRKDLEQQVTTLQVS